MGDNARTGLSAIQRAVVCASPTAFRDAIVSLVDVDHVTVITLDGDVFAVETDAPVSVGDPVAYHPVAEVIAAGHHWYAAR